MDGAINNLHISVVCILIIVISYGHFCGSRGGHGRSRLFGFAADSIVTGGHQSSLLGKGCCSVSSSAHFNKWQVLHFR